MLSVLVDGRSLGGDGAYRGFGRYLQGVLKHLAHRDDLRVSALVARGVDVPHGIVPVAVRRRSRGRLARIEHDLLLPRDIRRHPSDLFHAPAHDAPRHCARPWVQTLHDVIPVSLDLPGLESDSRRWRSIGERMRHATAVIAISKYAADEGLRLLGLDAARVHVAHHGVDERFVPPTDSASRDGDAPSILIVAEYGPSKGYADAFAVAGELAERGLPHRLRVAGRIAPWVQAEVDALRKSSSHPDRIELLGWVSDDELISLYQHATAVVVTSRAEGFCFPAVEAMACASPVVAYSNSALVEVVAEGGELVPDGDVTAMTRAVVALATDEARWSEASARALQRSSAFSWASSAQIHADVYRAALD